MNCINHPDRPRIAFCQNCGKPLCAECARVVGSAVFDETCLAERLAASQTGPTSTGPIPPPPDPASGSATRFTDKEAWEGVGYDPRRATPPPGAPNPGLAAVLGFIPGVGAMYNGQYAKGIVHLVVFAVLISLSDHNGFFGLFVTGWVFYQVFEAYHTAKARRDGTPLPNPFGLNDLGERLGFGKSWPAAAPGSAAAGAPPSPFQTGVPVDPYTAPATPQGSAGYTPYGNSPYSTVPPAGAAPWGAPADYPGYATVPPAATPLEVRPNRFPVGAVVLIGLGVIFLIGNAGWVEGFPVYRLFPFLLLGLGVWLFARRMLETGTGFADDGSPQYRLRLLRALRGSIWVIVVGLLSFLDSFHILSWSRSWPIFIVAAGVMGFLQRSAFASAAGPYTGAPYTGTPYGAPVPPSPSPVEPPTSSTAIVPADASAHRDGEV